MPRQNTTKSYWQLLHQYYTYTGFYLFVWNAVKKAIPVAVLFIFGILILNHFYDINQGLIRMTEILPVYAVLFFFFASETILGLVPPEIFIAWAGKMNYPWLYLTFLGFISYFGGLVSFMIGRLITKIPSIHNYLEFKMKKQLNQSRKWGGFLIVVGALLPLPFSISTMAAGVINFPFKSVVFFGSLRLLRFVIYGVIIFNTL